MNMIYKFTSRAKKTIELAQDEAVSLGHNYIGTEHILYGLVEEQNGVASKVLENQGVTPEKVMEKIEELVGINEENRNNTSISIGFTPRTKRIIENAYVEARNTNS